MRRMTAQRQRARKQARQVLERAIVRAVLAIPLFEEAIKLPAQQEILGLLRARRRL